MCQLLTSVWINTGAVPVGFSTTLFTHLLLIWANAPGRKDLIYIWWWEYLLCQHSTGGSTQKQASCALLQRSSLKTTHTACVLCNTLRELDRHMSCTTIIRWFVEWGERKPAPCSQSIVHNGALSYHMYIVHVFTVVHVCSLWYIHVHVCVMYMYMATWFISCVIVLLAPSSQCVGHMVRSIDDMCSACVVVWCMW